MLHLFTGCVWNTCSSFIQAEAERGIVYVEGWMKELFHSEPVNNSFIILKSIVNNCLLLLAYTFICKLVRLLSYALATQHSVALRTADQFTFIWWRCGTLQPYWRVGNAEDTFNQSNYSESKMAPECTQNFPTGNSIKLFSGKWFVYSGGVKNFTEPNLPVTVQWFNNTVYL